MSASRHTYGVTIRGTFTNFLGDIDTVFNLVYGPGGVSPAAFGSKREAELYATVCNNSWPSTDDTPNYAVIKLR